MVEESPDRTPSRFLLTGAPGIGKTTVLTRLAGRLGSLRVAGFYTEEVRKAGRRQGFRAVTFAGKTAMLAHVHAKSRHRVGRYGVDVSAFEKLALPELQRPADLVLIDEIGKMECFSASFVMAVERLLDSDAPLVATVALKGAGLIAQVKRRSDTEIIRITRDNRDRLPDRLAELLIRTRDNE
jgi:nucleoside-triphosphatase